MVKVALKNGNEEYILIHNEFESSKPKDFKAFAKRMYKYYCLLFLRYGKPVIPVALFSDDRKWDEVPPGNFKIEVGGKEYVNFNYHIIKLKNHNWREFIKYDNPLAYALMAKMELDKSQRAQLKMDFLNLVFKCTVNPARKGVLLNFIEKYIILNSKEQQIFQQLTETDKKYQEVRKMITVYEERGIKKGLEQGELKNAREDVLEVLKVRFKNIPYQLEEKINYCNNLKKLKKLHRHAITIKSINDLKV